MKRTNLLPLALFALAFGTVSCVSDDWDYDGYGYDGGYRPPPPPYRHDAYDDGYERGLRDGERHARDRHERDRREHDRYERDRPRGDAPVAVRTPKGYVPAGSFQAGSAVECGIPTSKPVKSVRLVATAGTVSVNTVVLREGSAKTQFPVSRRLEPGEAAEIDLGGARQATGLRISTSGKGSFNVYVR